MPDDSATRRGAAMRFMGKGSARPGMCRVEVMVALGVLCLGAATLLVAVFLGLRQTARTGDDVQYWADVQQVADSLMATGWTNVGSGSGTIRGGVVTWTVSGAGSNPRHITLIANRYT